MIEVTQVASTTVGNRIKKLYQHSAVGNRAIFRRQAVFLMENDHLVLPGIFSVSLSFINFQLSLICILHVIVFLERKCP